VGGIALAVDEADAFEPAHDLGHRGRRHAGTGREVGGGDPVLPPELGEVELLPQVQSVAIEPVGDERLVPRQHPDQLVGRAVEKGRFHPLSVTTGVTGDGSTATARYRWRTRASSRYNVTQSSGAASREDGLVRIGLLGPLEVADDAGRPVEVGGARLRT